MISINIILGGYLVLYLLSSLTDLGIDFLNMGYLRKFGQKVPEIFASDISEEDLVKTNAYTIDNNRFSLIKAIVSKIFFLFIMLSGLLPWFAESLNGLYFVVAGLIFFAVLSLVMVIVEIPFDYYRIFVIEENYGFNTRTLKTWFLDLLKGGLVGLLLGGLLLSGILSMVRYGGSAWWIPAWAVFLFFQIMVTILYPSVIAPLFNTFSAIENVALREKIEALAKMEGIPLKGIYQIDASRRSRHTNAYFSGLGKAKRIVLFDSLLESHGADEIMAVLSHEIGHLKKHHIWKQLALTGMTSCLLLFLASKMMAWEMLYRSFGFSGTPLYAGLFLVGILWEPVSFFISPIAMVVSRKFEKQADAYALGVLGTPTPLIQALKRLARDNLSNLLPHPLYVLFNASHPPIITRIQDLQKASNGKTGPSPESL